jgi:diaminopimelate epimerase
VNFVEPLDEDGIYVELMNEEWKMKPLVVEQGVTATHTVSAHNDNGFNRVEVKTAGGHLSVEVRKNG